MTPFLRRVRIRNYKSIGDCAVELQPLTFLVGVNGAGKSNFLDALRFVADSLRTSLDHALRERGGIKEVRRRSSGHPNNFEIRLDFVLPDMTEGFYVFRIGSRPQTGYEVHSEKCSIRSAKYGYRFFEIRAGIVDRTNIEIPPAAASDRLFLVNASGLPEFRPLYDALSHMGFYNLNPERIRDLQNLDSGDLLDREGSNLSSVLSRMRRTHPDTVKKIEKYLSVVVPGVTNVESVTFGPKETLEFRQNVAGAQAPWRFYANSMSDGTLRVVGILTALFQAVGNSGQDAVPLIGIEEPEAALHPAAAGALRDCLQDASQHTQVIVTSHSPDLLDDLKLEPSALLAVVSNGGTTDVGPIDEAGKSMMHKHLFTAGELLRLNQLAPDAEAVRRANSRSFDLFDTTEEPIK